jgi:NADP-dependent 3-hydroxy acid dehydrogenase YdfG
MTKPLDETVALVTGASSGIGAATARALAAQGAAVALVARRADRLNALASEIKAAGGRTLVLETDVTDSAQAASAVEKTVREFKRLDTVINNAGVMLLGPIENAPLEEWEQMVKINELGVLYVTHAALPHLLKAAQSAPRNVADLVNISSVAGRIPRRDTGVYNLTKFAIGAFSDSLRQEVTRRHVRVSLVEPGGVITELMSHVRAEVREQAEQRFANIERLVADDIADVIMFIVTRSRRVAINEVLVRPTEQEA